MTKKPTKSIKKTKVVHLELFFLLKVVNWLKKSTKNIVDFLVLVFKFQLLKCRYDNRRKKKVSRVKKFFKLGFDLSVVGVLLGSAILVFIAFGVVESGGISTTPKNVLVDGVTTTPEPPKEWWPPTTIHSLGEKVFGMDILPNKALYFTDAAWHRAVKDDVIKFVHSDTIMQEWSNRPIVWALYSVPQHGLWCARPVFLDDGTAADNLNATAGNCNTEAFDWVVGSSEGIIRHFTNRNECYEYLWNPDRLGFDSQQVACP